MSSLAVHKYQHNKHKAPQHSKELEHLLTVIFLKEKLGQLYFGCRGCRSHSAPPPQLSLHGPHRKNVASLISQS